MIHSFKKKSIISHWLLCNLSAEPVTETGDISSEIFKALPWKPTFFCVANFCVT